MSSALKAASLTIQNVLLQSFLSDQALASYIGAGAVVSLATPDDMESKGQFGLSIWLYRLIRDEQTLNQPAWYPAPNRLRSKPLPVRLHYLFTPITASAPGAGTPETEQLLLGRVLQTFNDKPLLSGADLLDAFRGTDIALAVRLETLELENIARIWDSLERSYQLCLSYEVGIVPIESAREDVNEVPVAVALPEFGIGQLVSGP
jgi:Pvc16 N-terminal domain